MQLVNIGFGNIVSASRIIAIVSPESAPIKRLVQEAKDNKVVVDATYGRRTGRVDKDIGPAPVITEFPEEKE